MSLTWEGAVVVEWVGGVKKRKGGQGTSWFSREGFDGDWQERV